MKSFLQRHASLSIAVLALLAAAGGAAAYLASRGSGSNSDASTSVGQPRIGGAFELLDRNGHAFTEKDLLGRPFALYFGYTRCPDVCPTTLMRLATWRRALGADGERLQIVFVSVDPDIDTPASVGNYADLFHANILGLTGTPEHIARIASAYRVVYAKVPQPSGGYNIDHSTYAYLVDDAGRLFDVISPLDSEDGARAKLRRLVSR
ncbi:MAG: SCO family protein [Steroidobacteraceae bacterium]